MSSFSRERNLYKKVSNYLSSEALPDITVKKIADRRVYLVGETHLTRDAVDYVHTNIAPKIISDQNTWMILREGLHSHDEAKENDFLSAAPDLFYFTKLSKVLSIPAYDPIKSPLDSNVKPHILANTNLTELDIDSWYLVTYINLNRNLPETERPAAQKFLVEKFGKGEEYLMETLRHAQKEDGAFRSRKIHESLMLAWNGHARKEFESILEQNAQRRNILVSVGKAHLPAFSDDFKYIG